MLKAIVTFLALLALSIATHAQTPAKPTYDWVTLVPQVSTPSPTAEGRCWTQTDGMHCYYAGAAHGPFAISGGTVSLGVGSTTITSGTTTRVLYDNGGLLGEYTNTQLTALINAFSSSLSGAAPASGGGSTNFLRADGTWAAPAGTVTPGGSSGNVQYNNAGAFGGLTDTQLTTHINAVTSSLSGAAPASGGGTSNFLRADGSWAVPPGTTSGTVTTSGSPANGNLTKFTGASVISNGDLSGDATTAGTLVVTVGKVNGVTHPSGPSANTVPVVTSATSGGTVTYEAVPNAALANSAMTLAGHSVSLGGTQTFACADLSNGATGCSTATGTSGATIPLLNGTNVWSGQQSVTPTTLTISTATFTPNGTSNNYAMTLVHASCPCTLANPSATPVAGTSGQIVVIQSATGSDTIGTWGSQYEAPGGTSTLVLSTAANAVDILSYYVRDATHIELSLQNAFAH